MTKVIALLSGGVDSSTLVYRARAEFGRENVRALTVVYGQRHLLEISAAEKIARAAGVVQHTLFMESVLPLLAGSSQTDLSVDVPEGHYADETMKRTVVPNRNMFLLSLAAAWAISTGSELVAYAAHAGDHAIYPDCRPEFADAMNAAISLCDYSPPKLWRPFILYTKADIVRTGASLGVPYEKTYSCYKGYTKHCGKCGTCVERREAFQLAGITDPTEYA